MGNKIKDYDVDRKTDLPKAFDRCLNMIDKDIKGLADALHVTVGRARRIAKQENMESDRIQLAANYFGLSVSIFCSLGE